MTDEPNADVTVRTYRYPYYRPEPEPDTDTRCTHHDATGQCLDHQGHQGRHQPPTPPLSVEYPCTECGHVASQHYDEPHPYDAGCRECVDCNGFVSEAPAPPLSVSEG